jgi:hypothetical protein
MTGLARGMQQSRGVRLDEYQFGSIRIDGETYEHDVVIACGEVRKRKKKRSRPFRDQFGHTPLSLAEEIPWSASKRLLVGTGAYGKLPVLDEVKGEAERRGVELRILPTREAIEELNRADDDTVAILHVTC